MVFRKRRDDRYNQESDDYHDENDDGVIGVRSETHQNTRSQTKTNKLKDNHKKKITKAQYQKLLHKRRKLKMMISQMRTKETEDETEKEIHLDLCEGLETKLKSLNSELKKHKDDFKIDNESTGSSSKNIKALKRLEDDYKAGRLDKELYIELKQKYSE